MSRNSKRDPMQIGSVAQGGVEANDGVAPASQAGDGQASNDAKTFGRLLVQLHSTAVGGRVHVARDCRPRAKEGVLHPQFGNVAQKEGANGTMVFEKGGKDQGKQRNWKYWMRREDQQEAVGRAGVLHFHSECLRGQGRAFSLGEWFPQEWQGDVEELAASVRAVEVPQQDTVPPSPAPHSGPREERYPHVRSNQRPAIADTCSCDDNAGSLVLGRKKKRRTADSICVKPAGQATIGTGFECAIHKYKSRVAYNRKRILESL